MPGTGTDPPIGAAHGFDGDVGVGFANASSAGFCPAHHSRSPPAAAGGVTGGGGSVGDVGLVVGSDGESVGAAAPLASDGGGDGGGDDGITGTGAGGALGACDGRGARG